MEDKMYKTPKLERYGTFRELTKGGGGDPDLDFNTVRTDDFCADNPPGVPGDDCRSA
jgi:hypothetical protein